MRNRKTSTAPFQTSQGGLVVSVFIAVVTSLLAIRNDTVWNLMSQSETSKAEKNESTAGNYVERPFVQENLGKLHFFPICMLRNFDLSETPERIIECKPHQSSCSLIPQFWYKFFFVFLRIKGWFLGIFIIALPSFDSSYKFRRQKWENGNMRMLILALALGKKKEWRRSVMSIPFIVAVFEPASYVAKT